MNVHEIADGIEGWVRSRQTQAPVHSDPSDLDRFLDVVPREMHPSVDPAEIAYGPDSRERSLWSRLPPSSPSRTIRPFSFPSPVETGVAPNDRAHGVRWHGPGRESARAALTMLPGAFAPSFAAERLLSVPLLRQDVHVFALAPPYHMERAPPGSDYSGQYLLSGDVPRFIDGLIQAVADVRSLVRGLRDTGYEAVFVEGISQGGNIGAQALATSQVDGGTLAIPAVDFAATMAESPIARGVRRAARRAGFDDRAVREALQVVNPLALGDPVPDPTDIHVVYAEYDRQVPAETVEAFIEAWDGVSATRYPAGHRTVGLRILALRHQLSGWLAGKIAAADG